MSKLQEGPFREALESAFAKLFAIPKLVIKLTVEPASEAVSNAGLPAMRACKPNLCYMMTTCDQTAVRG